jgi:hypothetical protein
MVRNKEIVSTHQWAIDGNCTLRDFLTAGDRCFPRDFAVSWVFVRMTGPSEMGIIGNEAWFSRRFPHPGVRISRKVQWEVSEDNEEGVK